jgi:pimeloyl-ACP methyl ester carboxylesterase
MVNESGKDQKILVNGINLNYVDWGGQGKNVLLLHGLQDTARNWDHIAQELSKNYHVFALDARGHGDSDWSPGNYQFAKYVDDVRAVLEELDLKDTVLIGHSAGGKYAFSHVANDSSRVSGLVIIDMDPDAVNPGSGNMFVRYREEGDEWPDLKSVVERLRSRESKTNEDILNHLAEIMTNPLPNGGRVWKRDRQIVLEYERPGAWHVLPRIEVNTLIIRGSESPLLRVDVAQKMSETIPNCKLVEIPDGGHWCLDENPKEVINQLNNFINGLS